MRLMLIIFSLLLLGLVSCANQPSPPLELTPFVTLTPAPPTPLPTPTPLATPDFSPYFAAIKSEYSDDIGQAAASGVTRYQIIARLMPDSLTPPASPQIQAAMRVCYTNTETVLLNQVYFRLFPNTPGYEGQMTVSEVRVEGLPVGPALVSEESALLVPFHHALEPGQSVQIDMIYQTTLPTSTGPGNGLFGYDLNILSLAGFYPTIAVFDQNGWHVEVAPHFVDAVYSDVALYEVAFTVPAEMMVVTSGSIVRTLPQPDGSKTIEAVGGPMRDFFVAMSPNFQHLNRVVNGTVVSSYFPAGNEAKGRLALEVGAQTLDLFEQLFGPYPYQEFDLVAVPQPASLGGVEYPGLVALAERYYSGDDSLMEFVTAHEVAHQWWYGLVGNDPVTHPWLDEALAQYSVVHYFETRYGPHMRSGTIQQMFTPYHWHLRDTGADRPVSGPATGFSEPLYFPVVYGKGPLFFEAVRTRLGDQAYLAALSQYAARFRYGIAQPEDLLNTLAEVGGQPVDDLYRDWILE